jgi:hypothetical protein
VVSVVLRTSVGIAVRVAAHTVKSPSQWFAAEIFFFCCTSAQDPTMRDKTPLGGRLEKPRAGQSFFSAVLHALVTADPNQHPLCSGNHEYSTRSIATLHCMYQVLADFDIRIALHRWSSA